MLKDYENIIDVVVDYYGISREDLISRKKIYNIVHARRMAIYLLRNYTGGSARDIGEIFNRDHATVLYANECITKELKSGGKIKDEIDYLVSRI